MNEMADRTIKEIKKIEEDIHLVLQVLRNEIETLAIIKEHVLTKSVSNENDDTTVIIQEEFDESVSSIEELIDLHKNLDQQIGKLETLLQDLMATKI